MRRLMSLPLFAALLVTAASATPITLGIHGGSSIPNLRDNQKDSANGKNATGALTVALGYAIPVGLRYRPA